MVTIVSGMTLFNIMRNIVGLSASFTLYSSFHLSYSFALVVNFLIVLSNNVLRIYLPIIVLTVLLLITSLLLVRTMMSYDPQSDVDMSWTYLIVAPLGDLSIDQNSTEYDALPPPMILICHPL